LLEDDTNVREKHGYPVHLEVEVFPGVNNLEAPGMVTGEVQREIVTGVNVTCSLWLPLPTAQRGTSTGSQNGLRSQGPQEYRLWKQTPETATSRHITR